MVIDDPHKWDAYKIVMVGGTKAMFKFVHRNGPIMSAVHMYDYEVKLNFEIYPILKIDKF